MPEFSLATAIVSAALGGVAGYVGSFLNQNRSRRLQRDTFLRALEAELSIFQEKLIVENDFLREFIEKGRAAVCDRNGDPLEITDHDSLIYRSNTSNVGLLDHDLAHEIVLFYQYAHIAKMKLEEWYNLDDEGDLIARAPYVRDEVFRALSVALTLSQILPDMRTSARDKLHVWCSLKRAAWFGAETIEPPKRNAA